jgi:3-methyladenine DNA glycosylase AlkD
MKLMEDTKHDLRELKMKIWRQKENNIDGWTPAVKEAKVLRGP